MYSKDELELKLLSELKEIAEELDLSRFKKLAKQDLIYKILDQQALTPEKIQKRKEAPAKVTKSAEEAPVKAPEVKEEAKTEKPKRSRVRMKRENVKNEDTDKATAEVIPTAVVAKPT